MSRWWPAPGTSSSNSPISGRKAFYRTSVRQAGMERFQAVDAAGVDGENPFPGDLCAGDFPRLDEQINLFFMNVKIPGDFFGIHLFSGHGVSPK